MAKITRPSQVSQELVRMANSLALEQEHIAHPLHIASAVKLLENDPFDFTTLWRKQEHCTRYFTILFETYGEKHRNELELLDEIKTYFESMSPMELELWRFVTGEELILLKGKEETSHIWLLNDLKFSGELVGLRRAADAIIGGSASFASFRSELEASFAFTEQLAVALDRGSRTLLPEESEARTRRMPTELVARWLRSSLEASQAIMDELVIYEIMGAVRSFS